MSKLKKKIANKICQIYDNDFYHFPKIVRRFLYRFLNDYRFGPFQTFAFPKIGRYVYSDLIKISDGYWVVYKTFVPIKFPELLARDIIDVQPMSGPISLTFKINYE